VDHYALDAEWETAMRVCAKQVMAIDDLADRKHDCDVLLDQNYYSDLESRYTNLVPKHCKQLLGPKYALLRQEFAPARRERKIRDGKVERIFLFFGGSDLANETGKAIRAIRSLGRESLAVDVVVGEANPHYAEVASLCAELPGVTLYRQVGNIAELMASADLAIGAGGSTTWERCALGLPSIVVSLAENQVAIAEGVHQMGAQIYLGASGEVTPVVIADQIEQLLRNPQMLVSMSEKAQQLVDPDGARRVCDVLMGAV
jgi:UDP-2,4-diacetamido-2,4,6-trideoxy-beta-L-altropyranose hydrolase